MTQMHPGDFFLSFLCEDYEDWKREPHSIRKAFHTAVSAFHLADHFYRFHQRRDVLFAAKYKTLTAFQIALTARTPSFTIIQDVANTYKHLYTRASCSIASGGAIESVSFKGDQIEPDWEGANHRQFDVLIHHRDGRKTRFSSAIMNVVDMWSEVVSRSDPTTL